VTDAEKKRVEEIRDRMEGRLDPVETPLSTIDFLLSLIDDLTTQVGSLTAENERLKKSLDVERKLTRSIDTNETIAKLTTINDRLREGLAKIARLYSHEPELNAVFDSARTLLAEVKS
jgi:regulator of replication initiation timing